MKVLNNIYSIFEEMKMRKAMYLGNDYTFQSLDSFVTGFQMAANEQQLKQKGAPDFGYFSTWLLGHIDEHYGHSGGWYWQIRKRNFTDDTKAFDDFFNLLNIFKSSTISSQTIKVIPEARNFSTTGSVKRFVNSNMDQTYGAPFTIDWINISNSTTIWLNYLDENGNVSFYNWYLNEVEASNALEHEFGKYLRSDK